MSQHDISETGIKCHVCNGAGYHLRIVGFETIERKCGACGGTGLNAMGRAMNEMVILEPLTQSDIDKVNALHDEYEALEKAQNRLFLRFFVPSNPIPKARPRTGKGHAYTPKRTKEYEALVKQWASIAIAEQDYTMPSKDTPLLLVIHFYREDKRGADLDNLQKAIWDALNKLAYPDDKQVEAVIATVTRGGNYVAGAMVTVAEYYPELSILENLDSMPK